MSPLRILSYILVVSILLCSCENTAKEKDVLKNNKQGKLFIIGGGDRTDELMSSMIQLAQLTENDFIAVLPMAGEEPDSSFWYFQKDLPDPLKLKCKNFNFSDSLRNISGMADSLRKAKLIFICGGDQSQFMKIVNKYQLAPTIIAAFNNGSMIAGTSAGAAVMSDIMITGDQLKDTSYSSTYALLEARNGIYSKGLGFIKKGIIDQHFVTRSRYNRILSALADYPHLKFGLGVEEETAAYIEQNNCTVIGKGPVILFQPRKEIQLRGDLIDEAKIDLTIFGKGKSFQLP